MKKIVNTKAAPAPIGPYNQAIKTGNTLFVSGQVCIDASTGELITGSITDQTAKVMKNIEAILKEAGMDFTNIVKSSIFLKNMDDFTEVNEEYSKYFKDNFPARETVEVARLPKNANVEISVIAVDH